jgi:hypothetical protein
MPYLVTGLQLFRTNCKMGMMCLAKMTAIARYQKMAIKLLV